MKAQNDYLQELISKGGNVKIPPGTYWVDASVEEGLRVYSDTKLDLTGVVLRAIPNDLPRYFILRLDYASDVTVTGGKLVGERYKHTPKKRPEWPTRPNDPSSPFGEWGMGISVKQSKRIGISGVTITACWGDGIYIQQADDVIVKGVRCTANRRQGMSIIAGSHIDVIDSVFENTSGTKPSAGIDIEPDNSGHALADIMIRNCHLRNNRNGLEFALKKARSKARDIRYVNCKFDGNADRPVKSDTFSWWQDIVYRLLGTPESMKIV